MREHRSALMKLGLIMRRDQMHIAREYHYLQQMALEEEHTILEIRNTNLYIEKSCKGLLEPAHHLQEQHRVMAQDYQQELAGLRQDESILEDVKRELEQKRQERSQLNGQRAPANGQRSPNGQRQPFAAVCPMPPAQNGRSQKPVVSLNR